MKAHCTVYKLGGSLASFPELGPRLTEFLQQQTDTKPLLVAGGGDAANAVRNWDKTFQLGNERSHWIAIRALTFNAHLIVELIDNVCLVRSQSEASIAWENGQIPIIDAFSFVESNEPSSPIDLPHNWAATSDTVAAWIAVTWPADRFVLLKSTDKVAETFKEAAASEIIDSTLPSFATHLPDTFFCNLRGKNFLELRQLQISQHNDLAERNQ